MFLLCFCLIKQLQNTRAKSLMDRDSQVKEYPRDHCITNGDVAASLYVQVYCYAGGRIWLRWIIKGSRGFTKDDLFEIGIR